MQLILHNLKHYKLKSDILIVGVTILATIVIWTGYTLYTAFNSPQVDKEVAKLLPKLDINLNLTILNQFRDFYMPPEQFSPIILTDDRDNRSLVPLNSDAGTITADENPPVSASPAASIDPEFTDPPSQTNNQVQFEN